MMRRNKTKKTSLVVVVLMLVLLISLGYAALTTTLNVNGTATLKKHSCNIYFNNVQVKSGSISGEKVLIVPETNGNITTQLTWSVSMDTPGEFYEFNVDVVNGGSIDAMVNTETEDIVTSSLTEAQLKYLDYTIKYSNGENIEKYDKLAAGETKTITVKLLFKQDVNPNDLPETEQNGITLRYETNYVQADNNAVTKVTSSTESIVWYSNFYQLQGWENPKSTSLTNVGDFAYGYDEIKALYQGHTINMVRLVPAHAGTITVRVYNNSSDIIGRTDTISLRDGQTATITITQDMVNQGGYQEIPLSNELVIGENQFWSIQTKGDTGLFKYANGSVATANQRMYNYLGTSSAVSYPSGGPALCVDMGYCSSNVNNNTVNNNDEDQLKNVLSGKNFSILGDSISTYTGYSNDATNTNNTIGNNKIFYTGSKGDITNVNYTWWKQLVDETNMNLLVNNSSSGSKVVGVGNVSGNTNDQGIGIRPQNLHDNTGDNAGTNPDIIAVYMGINDLNANYTAGSYESIDFNTLITNDGGTYSYASPSNFAEGYAIMLHKIKIAYPNADVFVMNMPLRAASASQILTAYNDIIQKLATHFNMNLVSLYDSQISGTVYSSYAIGDNLHPNQAGMDIMTETFINALKNKYLN